MLQSLVDKTRTWAIYHDLDTGDMGLQLAKIGEEFGELCGAMIRGEEDAATDAIGDMFIALNTLSLQRNIPIEKCIQTAFEEVKNRKGEMRNGTFVKEGDLNANRRD